MTWDAASEADADPPGGDQPLSEAAFNDIYARVPRLTVEVVNQSPLGILLTRRESGPCAGLWHIPGGTVRFAEPVVAAVKRVAATELGFEVSVGPFLGYIEYPSHYLNGLDSPVGLAFLTHFVGDRPTTLANGQSWFTALPDPMHTEQRHFLLQHRLAKS